MKLNALTRTQGLISLTFVVLISSFCYSNAQIVSGCSSLQAINFNPIVTLDDGSCLFDDPCGNVINTSSMGYGFFASKNESYWAVSLDGANGSADFYGHQFILSGSELGLNQEAWSQVFMPAPVSGIYTFDWNYITEDSSPVYDPALYIANNNYLPLSDNNMGNVQSGSVSFFANEGEFIGWLVRSLDSVGGRANLYISSFTYPVECIVGCTYADANNYNASASFDDGTCILEPQLHVLAI
jgi:hypothetical protein